MTEIVLFMVEQCGKAAGNYNGNNIQYIEDVKANAKGYEYLENSI